MMMIMMMFRNSVPSHTHFSSAEKTKAENFRYPWQACEEKAFLLI